MEVDLAPGEFLFLPVGWWHHVQSLDRSITVSFNNFRFFNNFTWANPDKVTGKANGNGASSDNGAYGKAGGNDSVKAAAATAARSDVPSAARSKVVTFPEKALLTQPLGGMAAGFSSSMRLDSGTPEGVLVIYDYINRDLCKRLADYADAQTFTDLNVVDYEKSTANQVVSAKNEGRVTHHVDIDGMACEILNLFNDIYCNRLAPFYNADFEWYERPQILRYPAGGKYNQHADADHWMPDTKTWVRAQDRDYSVLLYLNDEYEGGEIQLINHNYTIKPKPGMLLAFPSDYKYLHAALPTLSGIRYVIVSWAAVVGSKRVRPQAPYASVYVRQKRSV